MTLVPDDYINLHAYLDRLAQEIVGDDWARALEGAEFVARVKGAIIPAPVRRRVRVDKPPPEEPAKSLEDVGLAHVVDRVREVVRFV